MSSAQPRPGSLVTVRTAPPPRTVPTDTDTWFVAGLTDKGPLKPVLVQSLQEFVNNFGTRQTYSVLYDAIETYFREGGARAYISRVVGPSAVIATLNLSDGSGTSLVVKAKGPGAYGNTLRITVQNPGLGGTPSSFSILVADTVLGSLEQSPDFTTQDQAVAWSQQSAWVDITLGATALIPVAVSAAALTTGTDDRSNVVDASWQTALDRFVKDLGPGQVTQIGRTTSTAHLSALAHAAANNRFALLDLPDSGTVATVTTATTTLRGTANDSFGMGFAPWVVIPGTVPGTTRIVPPSALAAAKIAANDGAGGSPNKAAAGFPEGVATFVIGLSQVPYDSGTGQDVTRDAMYSLGVNQIVLRYGNYQVFGWRTLVDPNGASQDWVNAGNRRLAMAMTAKALAIMETYILDEIDGQGRLFAQLKGQLTGMCSEYYNLGSLYGLTPEEAFIVDTGPQVNTVQSIAAREIHASIATRMSPDAELVVLEISKIPVSQSL